MNNHTVVCFVHIVGRESTHDDCICRTNLRNVLPLSLLQVEQSKVLLKEGGVQLLLTIVDTPGFGDAVDNSNW